MDLVDENCVCIDCGANTGQETVPWAEKGAEVHAFEPHPECFRILKEKTASYDKVYLYEKGVWHRNSTMKLYLREGAGETDVSESSSLLKSGSSGIFMVKRPLGC
jgi:FkbM family methyltransferase